MSVKPGVEHSECTRVDDSQSVSLSSFKRNRRILVVSRQILSLVSDIDESGVCRDELSVIDTRR